MSRTRREYLTDVLKELPWTSQEHGQLNSDGAIMYSNRPMTTQPKNMSLKEASDRLFRGEAVRVDLQPGDCTKYELLIAPYNPSADALIVTWLVPEPMRTVYVSSFPQPRDFEHLAGGNAWTEAMICTFCHDLFRQREMALMLSEAE